MYLSCDVEKESYLSNSSVGKGILKEICPGTFGISKKRSPKGNKHINEEIIQGITDDHTFLLESLTDIVRNFSDQTNGKPSLDDLLENYYYNGDEAAIYDGRVRNVSNYGEMFDVICGSNNYGDRGIWREHKNHLDETTIKNIHKHRHNDNEGVVDTKSPIGVSYIDNKGVEKVFNVANDSDMSIFLSTKLFPSIISKYIRNLYEALGHNKEDYKYISPKEVANFVKWYLRKAEESGESFHSFFQENVPSTLDVQREYFNENLKERKFISGINDVILRAVPTDFARATITVPEENYNKLEQHLLSYSRRHGMGSLSHKTGRKKKDESYTIVLTNDDGKRYAEIKAMSTPTKIGAVVGSQSIVSHNKYNSQKESKTQQITNKNKEMRKIYDSLSSILYP